MLLIDRVFDDHIVTEMTNELLMESHGNCKMSKLLLLLASSEQIVNQLVRTLNKYTQIYTIMADGKVWHAVSTHALTQIKRIKESMQF